MIVIAPDGIVHEVYNKTEIREYLKRVDPWVERWQVRTLCSPHDKCEFLGDSIRRAEVYEADASTAITCVRCFTLECDHGISFDEGKARSFRMTASQVRTVFPRLEGTCPRGCGYHGIAYASQAHYIYGDW